METQLLYRNATAADIDQFIELGLLAYGQYTGDMTDEDLEKMKTGIGNTTTWTNILDTGKGYVCEQEGRIVGMAFLISSGNAWDIFPAEWSYIRMVGVHPAWQGQGIARRLMQQCVDGARAAGERVVALHTSEKMHAARHIYENMGFTILREIPRRLGMRYWLYTLELDKQQ